MVPGRAHAATSAAADRAWRNFTAWKESIVIASTAVAAPSIAKAWELPRVVQLQSNLFAAAFPLMKLLPARFIIEQALASGALTPIGHVVETTSGTFGLGLALVCRPRGIRVTLVSDPVIDGRLRRRLELLGATVDVVSQPSQDGGFQQARLDRVAELLSNDEDTFCPLQYENPENPLSYAALAEHLVGTLGSIDCIVGPTGSGGSMCGTTRFLRVPFPEITAVAVDTPGSVLFGQDDAPRLLRGLGNSLMPPNLDHSIFDEIHWVGAAEAFRSTVDLYRASGLFMGPTSGAAHLVAAWWARKNPEARVAVLMPDEGYRYESTVYDEDWLHATNTWRPDLPLEPQHVSHPHDAGSQWSWMHWGRRSLGEVLRNVA